jgi:hypothetical protein
MISKRVAQEIGDIYGAGMESNPLQLRQFIDLLYQLWMIYNDDCGAVSGMNDWQGKLRYWRKPAPVPLCPPQTPP